MIPVALDALLTVDPLAPLQRAIVATIRTLLPGVSVQPHPGKVDISELVGKSVVAAPGIGIGWSRIRRLGYADGGFSLAVEWTAYIVAEPKMVAGKRVEKEAVALAIGAQLLAILGDPIAPFWGLSGVLPPEEQPQPEFKPLFTVKDAAQGTVYYTVTWTQAAADLGASYFPGFTGIANPESGTIDYDDPDSLAAIAPWIGFPEVPDAE